MNIVWFSWKDLNHPQAGGAETVSNEIMRRLVRDGHNVKLLTARYENSTIHDTTPDGIEIYRQGSRFTVYPASLREFKKHFSDWADVTIDEMNTIPFVTPLHSKKTTNILFVHQLAREVWFYQMIFPLSLIGFYIEPFYLRFMSKRYTTVATVSNSTKNDLERFGFQNVDVFPVGMDLEPLAKLEEKNTLSNVLILGAVRPMKRTLDAVQAFEYARDINPSLKLTVVGDTSSKYAAKVIKYINSSRHSNSIYIRGRVSNSDKLEEVKKSDVIIVASIKEGWGLIVTEANSQGTPAVGYVVDGLKDSIKNHKTGILSQQNTPVQLGAAINELLSDKENYHKLRHEAWKWSKEFTFENSYQSFLKILNK